MLHPGWVLNRVLLLGFLLWWSYGLAVRAGWVWAWIAVIVLAALLVGSLADLVRAHAAWVERRRLRRRFSGAVPVELTRWQGRPRWRLIGFLRRPRSRSRRYRDSGW